MYPGVFRVPVPIPPPNATTTPVAKAAAKAAAETAHAAAKGATQPLAAAGKAVGAIGKGILASASKMMPMILIGAIFAFLVAYSIKKYLESSVEPHVYRTLPFLVYDPQANVFRMYVMSEVAPGIFVTSGGELIGLVSKNSRAVNIQPLPLKGKLSNYAYAYYGHKLDSLILNVEPFEELQLSLFGHSFPVTTLADLLIQLYVGKVVTDMPIAPNMRLVMNIDPAKAADMISYSYGRHAEESIISVVSLTGRRKEFEQQLKALYELEKQRAELMTSTAFKIAIAIMIVVMATVGVMGLFGRFGH